MTMAGRRAGAAVVTGMLVAGWVVSVAMRSWQGVEIEIVPEVGAIALAAGALYAKMGGRPPSDRDPEGGAAA